MRFSVIHNNAVIYDARRDQDGNIVCTICARDIVSAPCLHVSAPSKRECASTVGDKHSDLQPYK